MVRVHPQQPPEPLLGPLRRVEHRHAFGNLAGIHPEVGEPTDVRVTHDLKRQRAERRVIVRWPLYQLARLRVRADDGRHVVRRREVVDHGVQHELDALVPERGAAEHRRRPVGQRRPADRLAQLRGRHLVPLHVANHELVVHLGHAFHQALALAGRLRDQRWWDVLHHRLFVALRREVPRLLLDDVDHALELGFHTDGELDGQGTGVQALRDHIDRAPEVRAHSIHLVHEADAGHPVAVRLAPHRLRLRFHPVHRIEHDDAAVQHAQAPLHLDREVDVAGCVDDVDPVVLPVAGGRGGGNRNAALPLLGHPVHHRRALVHFTDLVGATGVEEHPLGHGGLPRVDVGDDADIPDPLDGVVATHDASFETVKAASIS